MSFLSKVKNIFHVHKFDKVEKRLKNLSPTTPFDVIMMRESQVVCSCKCGKKQLFSFNEYGERVKSNASYIDKVYNEKN